MHQKNAQGRSLGATIIATHAQTNHTRNPTARLARREPVKRAHMWSPACVASSADPSAITVRRAITSEKVADCGGEGGVAAQRARLLAPVPMETARPRREAGRADNWFDANQDDAVSPPKEMPRVRSQSPVASPTASNSQHTQRFEQRFRHTANAARPCKRPDNLIRLTGQLARPIGATACRPLCTAWSASARVGDGFRRPARPPAREAGRM